jgi:hypothetical protein
MSVQATSGGSVTRSSPSGGTLADILDRVLDKGIVIDAWAAVSLLGVEILTIQAKVVVASVETYLKYADAIAAVGTQPAEKPKPIEASAAPKPPAMPLAAKPKALAEPNAPQAELPSADELTKYLGEHAGGLRLEQLAEHFHASPKALEEAVGHLVEAHKARRDHDRSVILPAATKS